MHVKDAEGCSAEMLWVEIRRAVASGSRDCDDRVRALLKKMTAEDLSSHFMLLISDLRHSEEKLRKKHSEIAWVVRTREDLRAKLQARRAKLQAELARNGVEGAKKRWEEDKTQTAKKLVRAEWDQWQRLRKSDPDLAKKLYRSQAAFVRAMLERNPVLTSFKVLDGWCTGWKKETPDNPV